MKICYLSNTAIPSSMASSIQIIKMCEAFSELSNEVTLITTNVKKKKKILLVFTTLKVSLQLEDLKNLKLFH